MTLRKAIVGNVLETKEPCRGETSNPQTPKPQQFLNGEIHDWYRIILGYSDHLVADLLTEFRLKPGDLVLDPFCGTGTTLIECMKKGISSVGVDANPSSTFAAQVKANWAVQGRTILTLLEQVRKRRGGYLRRRDFRQDPTHRYLSKSGMLKRGWISSRPLRKAIALKRCIQDLNTDMQHRNILTLALIAEVVATASNVKFGPELYCGPKKKDSDVFGGFSTRVVQMAADLTKANLSTSSPAKVFEGDSRAMDVVLDSENRGPFSAVICSPPYPAEHDYTRNARLELAFLELVKDTESLRCHKRKQIRSHTKNIYKGDKDSKRVSNILEVRRLSQEIRRKVRGQEDGFARYYPRVIGEYFGGMKRHFESLLPFLADGALCAYVVGDQSAYAGVHIPTADLLAEIATSCGYRVEGVRQWRMRRSKGARNIAENILVLRKPEERGSSSA